MSGTPIGRLKFKCDDVNYSVVTVWRSDKGLSISMDKNTEKYPAMNPIEVLKKWASGKGFLNYFPASGSSNSGGGQPRSNAPDDDFGDLPF